MRYILFFAIFSFAALQAAEENIAEKVTQYSKILQQKGKLNKQKRELAEAIIAGLPNGTLETPDFQVTRHPRLSIRTSLDEARKLNATKMVEQVDKEKIKQLYLSGIPVKGVEEQSSLSVKAKKQKP